MYNILHGQGIGSDHLLEIEAMIKDIYGNVVETVPLPAESHDIICQVLARLEAEDYRSGFNDTVLTHICAGVNEKFPGMYWIMWNDCCMIEYKYKENPESVRDMVSKYMDDDWGLMERWYRVDRQAEQEGAFVMPEWGTHGT